MSTMFPKNPVAIEAVAPGVGTGIAAIERVTLDGARLKDPGVAFSGTCDRILIGHLADRIPQGGRVLDLGSGTGANGLYFARNSCSVELVDISGEAIRLCLRYAAELGLTIKTEVADVRSISLPTNSYDLVILSYVLQFMSGEEGRLLIEKSVAALKPGGFVYISTFSIAEQIYKELVAEAAGSTASVQRLDEFTFKLSSGRVMHFQTSREMLDNCRDLKCLHFFEGMDLDETHDAPHYHSFLSYIGSKPHLG